MYLDGFWSSAPYACACASVSALTGLTHAAKRQGYVPDF